MKSHSRFPDSGNSVQVDPEVNYKICQTCRAKYPLADFGQLKMSRTGNNRQCCHCRSQFQRLYRVNKYASKSRTDDSVIRYVLHHNRAILKEALTLSVQGQSTYPCLGFNTITKEDFKIFFGPSSVSGLKSISIFNLDGSVFRELAYSGREANILETIIDLLKTFEIRLERTALDVINSKTMIYYI